MTEKRFTVIDHNEWSEGDIIYYDDGKEMGWMDVCDKLNELAEENKDLEEARSYYQENFLTMKTERNQLKKENKELMKLDENRKEYQRILESKIRRLKDRIKVLEKR